MADKELLRNMIDSLTNDDQETAQAKFHEYLKGKMSEIVNPVVDVTDEDNVESMTEGKNCKKIGYENEEEMMKDMDYDDDDMEKYNGMMDDMDSDSEEKMKADMDEMSKDEICKYVKKMVADYRKDEDDDED